MGDAFDEWIGPYDIRVKNYVPYVPAKDGVNRVTHKNGNLIQITDIKNTNNLTKDEYLNEYCYSDKDGFYHYNASLKHEHNIHAYRGRDGTVKIGNIYKVMKHRDDFDDDCFPCIIL
jgi:hypothetical protein